MSISNKINFSYYFGQNILTGIAPLISLTIFTRVFSPKEYGLYALLLIFGNFFSSIVNFGLNFSYEKLFFELDENKKTILLNSIILFCFFLFILFFLPIYILGNKIILYFQIDNINASLLYLSYIASNLISFSNFFLLKYRNDKKAKNYSYLSLVIIFGQLLVSILLIIYFGFGIDGFFYSSIIVNLLVIIYYTKEFHLINIISELNHLKKAIIIAFPLFPKIFIGFFNSSYDKILLGFLRDQGSLGVYDISYKISMQCYNLCNVINNTFLPDFYLKINNWNEHSKKEIPNFLIKYFVLYIIFCLCLSYFSFELVSLILSNEFHFTINIISILCIFFSFYFFQTVPVLVYLGKSITISSLTAVFFLISLSIVLPGTYYFGIYGLAIGLSLSNLIFSIVHMYICQKNLQLDWNFRLIIKTYFYFILTTSLIITLRKIELLYIIRLIIKMSLLSAFIYYVYYHKVLNLKLYYGLFVRKLKKS